MFGKLFEVWEIISCYFYNIPIFHAPSNHFSIACFSAELQLKIEGASESVQTSIFVLVFAASAKSALFVFLSPRRTIVFSSVGKCTTNDGNNIFYTTRLYKNPKTNVLAYLLKLPSQEIHKNKSFNWRQLSTLPQIQASGTSL